jgi:hypothetical protein
MTPLHHSLIQILLPACIETTAKQREKPPPPELDKELWELLKDLRTSVTYGKEDWARKMLRLIAHVTKRPEIDQYAQLIIDNGLVAQGPNYDPLTVIVLEDKRSNHNFTTNKPYIIVNGKNFRLLHETGRTDDTRYSAEDNPRLATDEEIEQCLENLTAAQLRKIMTHDLFAPLVSRMYEAETELVAEKSEEYYMVNTIEDAWESFPKELIAGREKEFVDHYRERGWSVEDRIYDGHGRSLSFIAFAGKSKKIGMNSNSYGIIPAELIWKVVYE